MAEIQNYLMLYLPSQVKKVRDTSIICGRHRNLKTTKTPCGHKSFIICPYLPGLRLIRLKLGLTRTLNKTLTWSPSYVLAISSNCGASGTLHSSYVCVIFKEICNRAILRDLFEKEYHSSVNFMLIPKPFLKSRNSCWICHFFGGGGGCGGVVNWLGIDGFPILHTKTCKTD